ncbi:MAG TPA: winged helix-turn-helix domain-containing protein [Gammaproteobacteria bacterium]|nr:winged helix-turn-helix domain-containing protein [Gammaproteobacteria bacterium]
MEDEPELHNKNNNLYVFGPFALEAAERRLTRNGEVVPLNRKTFEALRILVESPGRLQTREELIQLLWPGRVVEEHNLTTKVYALRKALGDEGETPLYIETIRGVGYRFIAPVAAGDNPGDIGPTDATPKRRFRLMTGTALVALLIATVAGIALTVLPPRPEPAAATVYPTVAVLPFENLSADRTRAFFAEGLQDTILTRLAGIHDIRVISRTSSDSYASHPGTLKDIARELHATAVLEGSVQHLGNKVLINVQLIDAKTDTHLWAATYSRTLENVFDVEGDVAEQVGRELLTRLQPEQVRLLTQPPTRNPKAYVLFLQANYNADRASRRTNTADNNATARQAITLYRRAIELDPHFALAYARLSMLESKLFWHSTDFPEQGITTAEQDAKKALALNPDLPQALMASAYISYYGRRDYAQALSQFERARERLPSNADVITAIATIHRRQGQWQSALEELHQAARLDPRNSHLRELIGTTLITLRRYQEADQWLDRALALEPGGYLALLRKSNIALLTDNPVRLRALAAKLPLSRASGLIQELKFQAAYVSRDSRQALDALKDAPEWVNGLHTVAFLPTNLLRADALLLKGDSDQAHRLYLQALAEAQTRLRQHPGDPSTLSSLGLAEAGLGLKEQAIKHGREAVNEMPMSRDAGFGPFYLAALARIYGRLNQAGPATKLLDKLLNMPAGRAISVRLIAASPLWDGIRDTPAFQALLKKYEVPALTSGTSYAAP